MDEHQNQVDPNQHTTKERKQGSKWVFRITTSLLAVAAILFLAAFSLNKANVFPFDSASSNVDKTNAEASGENKELDATQLSTSNSEEDAAVVEAVDKASGAVVGVKKYSQSQQMFEKSQAGTGSGVIYKKENGSAYVVTNNHVIENAASIEVILSGGKKVEAELVGRDPFTDLAVLKMDGKNVENVAEFGSSKDLKVGETAIAIGNPLGMKFAGSVTKGIVSGLDRSMPVDINKDGKVDWQTDVLQTDAAINPGNSGGALINLSGEVIGINSMKIAKEEVEGLGFSIPTSTAKPIIKDLEEDGEVTRPFMGVSTRDLSSISARNQQEALNLPKDEDAGVVVAATKADSPADQAGLEKYDVITKADGNEIASLVELRKYIYENKEVGQDMKLTFYRDGQQQTTTLTLGE
ncbi:S1C family serine protease [Pontibacillus yanchengensis]|uniref:S1C family serine protease n=1 Tax=Pontibacillus yanchengensis TaxID=462910 RepID=UPI000567FB99|nr:S1C family serine protease [Pontibacillus yanchengensis]